MTFTTFPEQLQVARTTSATPFTVTTATEQAGLPNESFRLVGVTLVPARGLSTPIVGNVVLEIRDNTSSVCYAQLTIGPLAPNAALWIPAPGQQLLVGAGLQTAIWSDMPRQGVTFQLYFYVDGVT